MYLLIDLHEKDTIHLSLFNENKILLDENYQGQNRELITSIDDLLKKRKNKQKDIQGIITVVGSGGFTSTRIAMVVTNTLAYTLQIPILAINEKQIQKIQDLIPVLLLQPSGQYITASYSGPPNITTPKKK